MYKKITISAAILLVVGSLGLGWVMLEQHNHQKLLEEQSQRTAADVDEIIDETGADEAEQRLAAIEALAPDPEYERMLERHRNMAETRELVMTLSIMVMLPSGLALVCLVSTKVLRLSRTAVVVFAGELSSFISWGRDSDEEQDEPLEDDEDEDESNENEQEDHRRFVNEAIRHAKITDGATSSDGDDDADDDMEEQEQEQEQPHLETILSGRAANQAKNAKNMLGCDEDSKPSTRFIARPKAPARAAAARPAATNSADTEKTSDLLKDQTQSLQEQLAEFKKIAQDARESAQSASPVGSTLSELTEQVAALRQYAAGQQERVTRLQDGYDWKIIRNFCLRIIRCIDNIQMRIDQTNDKTGLSCLEEVRDELIFALESSGVEQFEPELHSEYRGQEKQAEAVKDKEPTEDESLKGKIAAIIRPGYQYLIDQEKTKIVRTAQVKLFA